jgi:hypothetical protein
MPHRDADRCFIAAGTSRSFRHIEKQRRIRCLSEVSGLEIDGSRPHMTEVMQKN